MEIILLSVSMHENAHHLDQYILAIVFIVWPLVVILSEFGEGGRFTGSACFYHFIASFY